MHERPRDTVLGLAYGKVRLVESDPGWPGAFQRLAVKLSSALGPHAVAIEHVGSTAVPGLAAKPILDVAVGLPPGADAARVLAILESLGWISRGDKGDAGLLLVLEDRPSRRVAHLHVVGFGDARWRRYLAFRDRLRADATARAAYAELKRDLAARFAGDRAAYTAAKHTFIAGLLAQP